MTSKQLQDPRSSFKGILLDLDGVVADSEPFHIKAWQQTCKDMGVDISDNYYLDWIGYSGVLFSEHIIEKYRLDITVPDFMMKQHLIFLTLIKQDFSCYPGLKEELGYLEDFPRGIVTSCTRFLADKIVEQLNLTSDLTILVTLEDVRNPKPAPDPYITAATKLGIPTTLCAALEDSPSGIQSARDAGCFVLGITNTHHKKHLTRAHCIFNNTREALQWIHCSNCIKNF